MFGPKAMDNDHTPVGRAAVTVLGCFGAVTLHSVNIWLSAASAIVSLIVGLLTAWVLIRKLTHKGKE